MHYFQMGFLAHEHQEELVRQAPLVCLVHALRSADRDDGLCFTTSCATSLAFFAQAKVRR